MKHFALILLLLIQFCPSGILATEQEARDYVTIAGAVNKRGLYYPTPTEMNLHAMILKAGGLSYLAGNAVTITRKVDGEQKSIIHAINFAQLMEEGKDSPLNLKIEPKDIVMIRMRVD